MMLWVRVNSVSSQLSQSYSFIQTLKLNWKSDEEGEMERVYIPPQSLRLLVTQANMGQAREAVHYMDDWVLQEIGGGGGLLGEAVAVAVFTKPHIKEIFQIFKNHIKENVKIKTLR